ncbi:hypothetical protein [Streptomyces neyagawaensis]|uniref:hypothetical protein n=1 Tax=Streptomyces neyagawaensis TaxID=42238 RepID=UPI000A849A92|nr:hypothetical protein [Streptomyces neyagawaensis]MCL6732574.1 hypothetical protein [Streptomyces neyagawaensis]MDE1687212.1 hypothetical protein [Streptomyces neyagawaensis]
MTGRISGFISRSATAAALAVSMSAAAGSMTPAQAGPDVCELAEGDLTVTLNLTIDEGDSHVTFTPHAA